MGGCQVGGSHKGPKKVGAEAVRQVHHASLGLLLTHYNVACVNGGRKNWAPLLD